MYVGCYVVIMLCDSGNVELIKFIIWIIIRMYSNFINGAFGLSISTVYFIVCNSVFGAGVLFSSFIMF